MAAKRGRKKTGKKRGKKKGARRSSAKRGAVKRTTLRAGLVVAGKPNKKTLKNNCMSAKKVGKNAAGKTLYKISRKAACVRPRTAQSKARAMLKKELGRAPTKREVASRVKLAKSFGTFGRKARGFFGRKSNPLHVSSSDPRAHAHWE